MRNTLVQDYAEIQHEIIYEILKKELTKLATLLRDLGEEANKPDP